MPRRHYAQRGIIKTIFLIILAISILSFFDVDLRALASSERLQENFLYVKEILVPLWENYIRPVFSFLWEDVVSPYFVEPITGNPDIAGQATSTPSTK